MSFVSLHAPHFAVLPSPMEVIVNSTENRPPAAARQRPCFFSCSSSNSVSLACSTLLRVNVRVLSDISVFRESAIGFEPTNTRFAAAPLGPLGYADMSSAFEKSRSLIGLIQSRCGSIVLPLLDAVSLSRFLISSIGGSAILMEPTTGFEPATRCLQGSRSGRTELRWHVLRKRRDSDPRGCYPFPLSRRMPSSTRPLFRGFRLVL